MHRRGVKEDHSGMTSSGMRRACQTNTDLRREFLVLRKHRSRFAWRGHRARLDRNRRC